MRRRHCHRRSNPRAVKSASKGAVSPSAPSRADRSRCDRVRGPLPKFRRGSGARERARRLRDERRHVRRGRQADRPDDRARPRAPRDQPARGRRQFPFAAQWRVPGAQERDAPRSFRATLRARARHRLRQPVGADAGDRRRNSSQVRARRRIALRPQRRRRCAGRRALVRDQRRRRCRWASSRAFSATGSRSATRSTSTGR